MVSRSPAVHTYYSVLKVSEDAPAEVIRAAYRSLSSKHHPDHNAQSGDAGAAMAAINRAYEVLSDPARRQEHDRWIRQGGDEDIGRPRRSGKRGGLLPVRLHSAKFVLVRYRRYWGGLAGATLMSVAVYALVPVFDDRDGAWLEHAWQQAWRPGVNPNPPISGTPAVSPTAQPAVEGSFSRGLNWETALRR